MVRRQSCWLSAAILSAFVLSGVPAAGAEGIRPELGSVAPDFTLETASGTSYSLSQLSGEKNALIVFFRGTW